MSLNDIIMIASGAVLGVSVIGICYEPIMTWWHCTLRRDPETRHWRNR